MTPITRRFLAPAIAALAAASLLAACGSGGSDAKSTTTAATGSGPSAIPVTPANAEGCRTAKAAAAQKFDDAPDPKPPTKGETSIKVTDDIPGCGDLVKATSTVKVHYILKSKSSGEVVDSSWQRFEPYDVTLGQARVISGWEKGIPGMRAGGRRTLVLGPKYGYGAAGDPPSIAANDTLIFVIDALAVS